MIEAKLWNGVSHDDSAFWGQNTNQMAVFVEAHALDAHFNQKLSFKEWVRTATCHHCGEKGHIKADCPKLQNIGQDYSHGGSASLYGPRARKHDRSSKEKCTLRQQYNVKRLSSKPSSTNKYQRDFDAMCDALNEADGDASGNERLVC